MGQVLGTGTVVDAPRRSRGFAHEAEPWRKFQADVAAGKDDKDGLFNDGTPPAGTVSDRGYWLGHRICESYYAHATDKAAAIRTMPLLEDPRRILGDSGHDPRRADAANRLAGRCAACRRGGFAPH